MRYVCCALALVFAALPFNSANAQSVRFEGTYVIKAVNGCGTDAVVGDAGTMRYAPAGVGNPVATGSGISFIRTFAASAYSSASGPFQPTLTTVNAVGIFNNASSFTASLALTFQDPTTIDASTQAVNLRGQVANFEINGNGCVVDFEAALIRRPN
jgi:hypothetical protein